MLTRLQIHDAIAGAGIGRGDHVLVHSSMRKLGPVDGGADAVIDSLLEVVGPDGTLAMPSFCYTPPEPWFDPSSTPGRTGALTEVFRRRPGVQRSWHPTHAIAAAGPRAAEFLADHHRTSACGFDSPLDRLTRAGAWVLLIGVSHTSNTAVHLGEVRAGVRKFGLWGDAAPPAGRVRTPDGDVVACHLDPSASCSLAFNAIDLPMRRHGWICDRALGAVGSFCHVAVMRARSVVDATAELVALYPDILFCTRPDCARCQRGRACARPGRSHRKTTGCSEAC